MNSGQVSKDLKLVSPHVKFQDSFLSGLNEMSSPDDRVAWCYIGDNDDPEVPKKNFSKFVDYLNNMQNRPPREGFVCCTVYWAVIGEDVVGRIALRHTLNDFLLKIGGHVGYIVRPSWRGKGVATRMLEMVLKTERAKKLEKVLVTCDPKNLASEKTIVKNGGVYENTLSEPKRETKRFWIRTK